MADHDVRQKNTMSPPTKIPRLITGISMCLYGAIQIFTSWDGLRAWWRIVNLSFDEVVDTPHFEIWTSGRGVVGTLFLIVGFVLLITLIFRTNQAK